MDPETRRSLLVLAGVGALVALAWAARAALGIEWSAESVRDAVAGFGLWGPALFVVLTGLRYFLLVPSQIMLMAAGLCFGAQAGTVYGALGLTLSGALVFGVARMAGRNAVLARVPDSLRWAFDAAGTRAGAAVVAVGTGYPVGPLTAFHAGAGLTAMSIPVFGLALGAGSLVRAGIYAYWGSALVGGDWRVLVAGAIGLALAAAPLVHGPTRAWLRRHLDPPR